MKKIVLLSLMTFMASLFSGCATIVAGTDQKLSFDSDPSGAKVSVDGKAMGTTPITIAVDKGQGQSLTFEKEDYETLTSELETSVEPWFFGNIILGGLLGSTTDGLSGAIHEFSPDQYYVTLKPLSAPVTDKPQAQKIREFLVSFGDDIRTEVIQGEGEKLSALLELLGQNENPEALPALKGLIEKNEDNLSLANVLIEKFEIAQS